MKRIFAGLRSSAILIILLLTNALYGQQNVGSIRGIVKDPSGGIIVGATLVARHEATGVETTVQSNSEGTYNFPALNVGVYNLTVSFQGFKTAKRTELRVVSGNAQTVDVELPVGEISETTTVTEQLTNIDTASTAIGTTRTVEEIKDLPLQMSGQARNYLGYLLTLPGISYRPGKSQATYDGLARAVIQGVGVNGFRNNYFSYNLDGVSGISFSNSGIEDAAAPIPEVVEEFRMTTNLNAESGANLGVAFDLVMKSGTNNLHGSVFEYLRNDVLDSRNFFANRVSPQKQNQFGVVLGGPLVLPKVYNGKNRTFFFGSYDGFRLRTTGQGQTATVPTARMRNGDFGELLGSQVGTDALGRPVLRGQIFDPLTTRGVGSSFVRDPFPNNVIPSNRLNSISLAFQKGYPLPTLPGTQLNWAGPRAPQISDIDRMTQKVDHNFGNHRLSFADDTLFRKTQDNSLIFAPEIRDTEIVNQKLYRFRILYTWTARPNLLFNFRTSFTRGVWDAGPGNSPNATYGAVAGLTKGVYGTDTPLTTVEGITGFGPRYSLFLRIGTGAPVNTDISWTKGNHNYKFGAEFLQQTMTNTAATGTSGRYNFRDRGTDMPTFTGSGSGYASFLLGDVDNGSIDTPRSVKHASRRWGFFAQDQWRVTSKLTVNYGLRYDLTEPLHESYYRTGSFDPKIPNAKAGGRLGALTFWGEGAGRNGRKGINDIYYGAVGPRLGLAYAVNEKTIVRAYYGLVYSPLNGEYIMGEGLPNYGWAAANVSTSTLDNGVTPAFNWINGFPALVPVLPNLDPTSLNGVGLDYFGGPGGKRSARSQNLGFAVERTLPGQFVVRAEYVGKLTHGLKISGTGMPMNMLDPRYLSLGSLLNLSVNSPQAQSAGIPIPYPGFVGSVAQALRPYPQYLNVAEQDSSAGFSTYHAMELNLQRRFKDTTFLASYTISKLLAHGAFQHVLLQNTRKALANADRPQTLNLSYTYELPFGRGKHFLNGTNPVLNHIIGGWQVAGIHNYFAGFPVTVTSRAQLPSIGGAWANRVNSVPIETGIGCSDYDPNDPLKNRVLNQSAFATPAPFTFGNTRVLPGTRDCGYSNENLTILKNFKIREGMRLRFGAEIFNVFNRHQWQGLNADIDNPAAFGRYSSASDPRIVQFQLKFEY